MDIRVISAVLMVAGMQGESAPSRTVGEVGKAHVVRSPVVMPAIMGDPKKVDALSVVLALAGVEDGALSRVRQGGWFRLRKEIGPFDCMEINTRARYTGGGFPNRSVGVEHLMMIAQRRGGTQEEHIVMLRSVRDLLSREIPSARFVESVSDNGFCIEEKTLDLVAGNWNIRLSLARRASDSYIYRLEMDRPAARATRTPQSADIDVDI